MPYTFGKAKKQIKFYVRTQGPYWNNIVASILKQVADEQGKDVANRLIRECGLITLGWKEEENNDKGVKETREK